MKKHNGVQYLLHIKISFNLSVNFLLSDGSPKDNITVAPRLVSPYPQSAIHTLSKHNKT